MKTIYTKISLLPIYLLFVMTMAIAGAGKFNGAGIPDWFIDRFSPTLLNQVPGLAFSYYSIAVFELVLALAFVISFIKGEFLPKRSRPWLLGSLLGCCFLFVQLGFGLRISGDHAGGATLFQYFVGTLLVLWYVETKEPSSF